MGKPIFFATWGFAPAPTRWAAGWRDCLFPALPDGCWRRCWAVPAQYAPFFSLLPCGFCFCPQGSFLCFGHFGWQACLRCLVTTLCAALLCGGALNVLLRSAPPGAAWAATAALCLLLYWLAALSPSSMTAVRQVELTVGEHSVLLPAMVDTGNLLRDPITGLPVLVVPFRAVRVLLPEIARWVQHQELPPRMRLISVRTAAGSSLLPVFRPDSCRLYLNGHSCDADVVVAVTGQEYGGIQALVPLAALPEKVPVSLEE